MRLTLRVRGLPRGIHLAGRGLVEGRISGVQSAASLTTGKPAAGAELRRAVAQMPHATTWLAVDCGGGDWRCAG